MNDKNLGGRPEVHGLEVITGNRVRRARLELCLGSTFTEIAPKVFRVSPKTLRRYTKKDDIRTRILNRAIEQGESLRGEPMGPLICYLHDKKEETLALLSDYIYQIPKDEAEINWGALVVSEEDEEEYIRLRKLATDYDERIREAFANNEEIKSHIKATCRQRGGPRIKGLDLAQRLIINDDSR